MLYNKVIAISAWVWSANCSRGVYGYRSLGNHGKGTEWKELQCSPTGSNLAVGVWIFMRSFMTCREESIRMEQREDGICRDNSMSELLDSQYHVLSTFQASYEARPSDVMTLSCC